MEVTAQPASCERCGTFVDAAALHLFRGKRLCDACHALARQPVRVWSTTAIAVVGTLSPPAGWILAGVNWWRLGEPARLLLPVAACVARGAGAYAQGWLSSPGTPRATSAVVWLGLNLGSVLLGALGLPGYVRMHRAAGGASGSWVTAVGLAIIPVFCFVALYQFFSDPPPPP